MYLQQINLLIKSLNVQHSYFKKSFTDNFKYQRILTVINFSSLGR